MTGTPHGIVPEGLPDWDDVRFQPEHPFGVDDALAWMWRHHASVRWWLDEDGHESMTLYAETRQTGSGAPEQSQFTFVVSSPTGCVGALIRAVSAARASTGLE